MPEPLLAIEMRAFADMSEAIEAAAATADLAAICHRAMSSSLCTGHAQAETVAAALMRSSVRAALAAHLPPAPVITDVATGLLKACATFAGDFQRSLDLNQVALAITRAAAGPLQASDRRLQAWTLASQAVSEALKLKELPRPQNATGSPSHLPASQPLDDRVFI